MYNLRTLQVYDVKKVCNIHGTYPYLGKLESSIITFMILFQKFLEAVALFYYNVKSYLGNILCTENRDTTK